ncbi:MAG TPA: RteC domain-containing protein [Cyclobacteriaceae bacterium]|nr:RteC domain-containing protein [Cyclobacteriaceae bacterium]HRF32382.1 RteC domain-containing protein [Cyclobacteriaceae bacterium]
MKQHDAYCEQCLADLHKKLAVIQRDQMNPLLQAVASYELVKEVINTLTQGEDAQRTPHFNKVMYPQFLSLLIYYRHVVVILSGEPLGTRKQVVYLKAIRKKLEVFCAEHRDLIQYCRSGSTERDDVYFGYKANQDLLPEESAVYVWSKYLAAQKLNEWLTAEIAIRKRADDPSDLIWTGPKTNLIELLYALHASNVFNDGKAGVKQVANAFEKIFQTSLGNYYRVFQDIRQRKINQTVFLDQLKEKFLQRVHELE